MKKGVLVSKVGGGESKNTTCICKGNVQDEEYLVFKGVWFNIILLYYPTKYAIIKGKTLSYTIIQR